MMFVLSIRGKEEEGAYAVTDDVGEKVIYLFLDKDDAVRYAGLLEADDFPEMSVVDVAGEEVIQACMIHGLEYFIVTQDDIVVPPRED